MDAFLSNRGYSGSDLDVARRSVRDWVRARMSLRGSMRGLAVVVSRVGRAELVPIEVALPGPDQITVEVLASAISAGTERAQWLRLPNARPELPFFPGYSGAGRVIAVGSRVRGFAKGDLVAVPRIAHASVATAPAKWALRIPQGVAVAEAASVYLAMISGYGVRRGGISSGDSVCVMGAGPIGALAARLARLAGAGTVKVVATSRRNERAASLAEGEFRLLSDGVGDLQADLVIEATGDPDAISTAIAAARDGGTVVLLGSPRGISRSVPVAELQQRGLRLVGAHISALGTEARRTGTDSFAEIGNAYLRGLESGAIRADDLAAHAIDPREIGLMYRRLAGGSLRSAYLDWARIAEEDRVSNARMWATPRLPPIASTIAAEHAPKEPVAATRRLRFAIVGCGDIGFANARAVARSDNAELVLVHDLSAALADAVAARHGGSAVPTLAQALDSERVDAVFLSVPHHLHAPMIEQAAAAGLHIVVEKPLAVDLASARAAVEAADAAGVTLSVCFPYRYESAPAAALRLIRAGALGPLRGAAISFHADKPQSYWLGGFSGRSTSDWRMMRERSGGGVMIMNMTHYVDLLRHLSESEITEVHAMANFAPGREVEDQIAATVRFDGGAVGTLIGSASSRGAPDSQMTLWGEHGSVELGSKCRLYTERALLGLLPGRWNELPSDPVDERRVFVERFAAAVLQGRRPDVTAADGMAVQAFVEAAYRSVSSGRFEPVALFSEASV